MKAITLALASVVALSGAASAQVAPPQFAPLQINQADFEKIESALGEIPAKYSIPLISFLNRKELETQAAEGAKATAKAAAPK